VDSHLERYITVEHSFFSRIRHVMGDSFMMEWQGTFDNDAFLDNRKILVKEDMILTALDLLMSERIQFLNELNKLFDLEENLLLSQYTDEF
jgi:hypothetical protein